MCCCVSVKGGGGGGGVAYGRREGGCCVSVKGGGGGGGVLNSKGVGFVVVGGPPPATHTVYKPSGPSINLPHMHIYILYICVCVQTDNQPIK